MRVAYLVVFIGDPLMVVLGFLMFRFPLAWAKMNARVSRKELREFDSAKQLAATKRLGTLMMILGPFSLVSVLAARALMQAMQLK